MAVAWYVVPYRRRTHDGMLKVRFCAMDDFTPAIRAEGGEWAESEILGDSALVKVRASNALLADIGATSEFLRLPGKRHDSLSGVSQEVRQEIRDRLAGLGYTGPELDAATPPNFAGRSLDTLLHFAASRRTLPRWDAASQSIRFDQDVVGCRSVESVDTAVKDQLPGFVAVEVTAWVSFLAGLWFGIGLRPPPGELESWARTFVRSGTLLAERTPDWFVWAVKTFGIVAFPIMGGSAFARVPIVDTFTRADENPLANGWLGPISPANDQARLTGNAAAPDAAYSSSYWNTQFGPDCEVYATISVKQADNDFTELDLRVRDPGTVQIDGYAALYAARAATDIVVIYRADDDSYTQLGASMDQEYSAGEGIGFDAIGSRLGIYRRPSGGSWQFVDKRDDPTYHIRGVTGLGFGSDIPSVIGRLDDFGAGTVVRDTWRRTTRPRAFAPGLAR